ncbi:MAG: MTH1187 family thiamine-binding protein [Bacillota bacterium]
MAIVEVSITPLGTATPSVSQYVARAHKILVETPGLKAQLTPMSTVLEGDLDLILKAIRQAQEAVFAAGALRVSTSIKIDDRRDRPGSMEEKVRRVQEQIGQR